MSAELINLTPENLAQEHLCCIIRTKKPHPGVEAKRQWLAARLKEGHVFRKLNEKATVFIEYAPLETAWVPIEGENFIYLYCLWACGPYKGKGYGRALMESMLVCDGQVIVSVIRKKDMEFYGVDSRDLEGIVSQLRNTKGVEVAIFLYETAIQEYKVSMRSNGAVDVSKITVYYNGGGHVKAAGCTMQGSIHDVINNLTGHIARQLDGEHRS